MPWFCWLFLKENCFRWIHSEPFSAQMLHFLMPRYCLFMCSDGKSKYSFVNQSADLLLINIRYVLQKAFSVSGSSLLLHICLPAVLPARFIFLKDTKTLLPKFRKNKLLLFFISLKMEARFLLCWTWFTDYFCAFWRTLFKFAHL